MKRIEELSEQEIAGMTREERIQAAKSVLKGLTAEQRGRVCSELPELCALLEGRKSSCSTSYGAQSEELSELTNRLKTLATELRKYGAAMQRKRREELRYQLVKLDLIETAAQAEAEEAA